MTCKGQAGGRTFWLSFVRKDFPILFFSSISVCCVCSLVASCTLNSVHLPDSILRGSEPSLSSRSISVSLLWVSQLSSPSLGRCEALTLSLDVSSVTGILKGIEGKRLRKWFSSALQKRKASLCMRELSTWSEAAQSWTAARIRNPHESPNPVCVCAPGDAVDFGSCYLVFPINSSKWNQSLNIPIRIEYKQNEQILFSTMGRKQHRNSSCRVSFNPTDGI